MKILLDLLDLLDDPHVTGESVVNRLNGVGLIQQSLRVSFRNEQSSEYRKMLGFTF